MSANIVKCNNCNIVISEVLAFIQNQVDVMNEDSIVRLCTTAFSSDEIVTAKDLLYQSVQTKEKKVKRKGKADGKMQRDVEDIISLIKCTAAECVPIFVARELRKLPPVTFDHIDVTRLLKDIIILKDQVEVIREEYATVEQVKKLSLELLNLKQASLVDGYQQENNYVNMNRGSRHLLRFDNFDLNSGPIGIMNLSKEIINTPERVNTKTAVGKMSLAEKQAQGQGNVDRGMSLSHAKPRSPSVLVAHDSTSGQADKSKRVEASTAVSSPVTTFKSPAGAHSRASVTRVTGVTVSAESMNHHSERRTYSQIAQDGGNFKTYKDEEWNTVHSRRLKNRFIGTQGTAKDPSGKFKAAESKVPLFVNNVDSESSVKDVADYILSKTNVVVQLTEIKMKRQRNYKAFKVFVPRHKLEIFLDEQLWPEGISFRRFINFKASEEMEQPDLPQAVKLLKEMNTNVQQVSQLVDNMLVRVKSGELSTDKGLSFLEMKYQMLLSYLINLTYIVLRKCSGERIESDPSIERLIEIRTVLEKIRPIDSKLKYQIDKLVKTAAIGGTSEDDPQAYHANPANLVSKINESAEESSESSDEGENKKEKNSKANIYVPPKLAAVHFDENTSRVDSDKKNKEKSKKQFLNSSIMRELRDEYSEAPLEVSTGNHVKQSISKYELEKTEYEENYLTRLPVTKAEKNRRKKLSTVGMIADEITGTNNTRQPRKHKMKSKKGKGFKRRRTQ